MLNQHQSFKAARKAGTASTDQDRTFKKPFRTVDYPPTIDHNMHDDYIRNPPKNIAESEDEQPRANLKWGVQDKIASQSSQEELGRIKKSDVQAELVMENSESIHS